MIKKIILSGGWGFGNLGDDAICMASVKLLHKKYPDAKILIETFDINELETCFARFPYVSLKESIYKKIFHKYNPIEDDECLKKERERLISKLKHKLNALIWKKHASEKENIIIKKLLENPLSYIYEHRKELEGYIKDCKNADLYVMSGGHILTTWIESLISKYIEVYIAREHGIKCILIGQTIGPFINKECGDMIKHILSSMDIIGVRDEDSVTEIERLRLNKKIILLPDLALTENFFVPQKNIIVFVPFKLQNRNVINVGNQLIDLSQHYKHTEIKIVLSQLWYSQINQAAKIYIYLHQHGCKSSILVPQDINQLQNEIANSRIVLSENLHGLILAYRSNRIVVCLNNKSKFISFMEQIHSTAIIDINELNQKMNLINLCKKAEVEQQGSNRIDPNNLFSKYLTILP